MGRDVYIVENKKTNKNKFLYLGKNSKIPGNPDKFVLQKINNPHLKVDYIVRFKIPEFTCLCPVTGQPDFAKIFINYVPDRWIIESKSLKLYIHSFRNIGIFHEDVIVTIGKKIKKDVKPRWIRVSGYFFPRGGIPIDVFWEGGKLPKLLSIPEQDFTVSQSI